MAWLSSDKGRFYDAHVHVGQAKFHETNGNNIYLLARAMQLQTELWRGQHRFEGAKSEALGAVEMFENLGVADESMTCGALRSSYRRQAPHNGPTFHVC